MLIALRVRHVCFSRDREPPDVDERSIQRPFMPRFLKQFLCILTRKSDLEVFDPKIPDSKASDSKKSDDNIGLENLGLENLPVTFISPRDGA